MCRNIFKGKKIFIICGPTASQKSLLAFRLAKKIDGQIINADSSQVYKNINLLSNIPSLEERKQIPHVLFSFLNLHEYFSVSSWLKLVKQHIEVILYNQQTPIIVGGSGFYISALLYGISDIPSSKAKKQEAILTYQDMGYENFYKKILEIEPSIKFSKIIDPQRLIRIYEVFLLTNEAISNFYQHKINFLSKEQEANTLVFYLNTPRSLLYQRINQRFLDMLSKGALKEAMSIMENIYSGGDINLSHIKKIIGLEELIAYLNEKMMLSDAIQQVQQKTRNYAKRQITWFNNKITYKNLILTQSNIDDNYKILVDYLRFKSYYCV